MAERATARKPAAKKPAARKATGTRTRKPRAAAGPMPAPVRTAAAAALAVFEERLLDHANIGFTGASTRELRGARSGMVKAMRFEVDGAKHRAAITIAYR